MNIQNIREKDQKVLHLVSSKRVKNALEVLKEMVILAKNEDLRIQHEHLESTYENMLKYTIEGIRDPERQRIYQHLLLSILHLSQQIRESILAEESGWHTYWLKKELEKEQRLTGRSYVEKLEDLSFKKELDHLMKENLGLHEEAYKARSKKYKEIQVRIFNHLWLTDAYKEAETELIQTIRDRTHFTWYERSIFVSAITLSLLRYFDDVKIFALMDFIDTGEDQVWQRALIGLVFGLHIYDRWLPLLPKVRSRLQLLAEKKGITRDAETILLQIIRSKDTEKISRKLREEIIPEMVKLQPNIQEKLDLDNLLPEDFLEDKNPKWEKVFEEAEGLYNKVEEFSKLQQEGADVFMSAFAMLKHFDFFRDMSNWFLPFYPENDLIDEALTHEDPGFDKSTFIEGLFKTAFLCNSDKYSFCLNVRQMPAVQKALLLKLFSAEMEGMNEASSDEEMIIADKKTSIVIRQYIQDLYRFFRLFPDKREFQDIFYGKLDLYHSEFFRILVDDPSILKNIADYFLDKNYYEEAHEIYSDLKDQKKEKSTELIEKIAFCLQHMGLFEEAIKYYQQAEMSESNRLWNLKKIGSCYRSLEQPAKALEYYLEAQKLEPENIYTQTSIGRCYLDMKDYSNALKYYFKVEYLDPKNKKVLRPIAWCYFALGNLPSSRKFYERLFENQVTKYDYLNRGHVEWCLGNKKEALEFYRSSMYIAGMKAEEFAQAYWEDREFLIRNGMDPDEIAIILDYLIYIIRS